MNQPKIQIRNDKCYKCGKPLNMKYHYDRRLSDWVCYEVPICEGCRDERMYIYVNERTGEQKAISNAEMEQSRINLHEWLQNQGFELLRTETWKDREKDNVDVTKNQ